MAFEIMCHQPDIELNLYQIQLLDDSGQVIKTNLTESPFQDPEILPSNRVGRWTSQPQLETFYELDDNQIYQLQLTNHSWKRCYAIVDMNETIITKKLILPRQTVTLTSNNFKCHQGDLIQVSFIPEAWTEKTLSFLANGEKQLSTQFEVDTRRQTQFLIRLMARQLPVQVIDHVYFRGYLPFGLLTH